MCLNIQKGGGIAQLVSRPLLMLGTRVRIPVRLDSGHPMHVWEGKRLAAVKVILHLVHNDFQQKK